MLNVQYRILGKKSRSWQNQELLLSGSSSNLRRT